MIKRISILLAVSLAAFGIVQVGSAADPPFPATKVGDLFLSVQTVDNTGAIVTQVKPGDTVIFRAYSLDPKTKKFLTGPEKRYFYLELPGVANAKFSYTPTGIGATLLYPWTASWTVPANYALGTVKFRALVRPKASPKRGSFLQTPVASSQLTVTTTPQTTPADGPPQAASPNTLASAPIGLYVDSVNGTALRALRSGRSAARRRTSTSAASSSCSAPGASTSTTAKSSRWTTSTTRTTRSPASRTSSSTGARTAPPGPRSASGRTRGTSRPTTRSAASTCRSPSRRLWRQDAAFLRLRDHDHPVAERQKRAPMSTTHSTQVTRICSVPRRRPRRRRALAGIRRAAAPSSADDPRRRRAARPGRRPPASRRRR